MEENSRKPILSVSLLYEKACEEVKDFNMTKKQFQDCIEQLDIWRKEIYEAG